MRTKPQDELATLCSHSPQQHTAQLADHTATAKTAAGRVTAAAVLGLAASMLALVPAAPHAAAAAGHAAIAPSAAATAARHLSRTAHLSPATAATIPGTHMNNFNSGMCLGISGGNPDALAVQWTCNTHQDQFWHWGAENGDISGFKQIVNGDGECLGVANGSTSAGAKVVGWTCLGSKHRDQYWIQLSISCNGYWQFANLKSGDVLGVASNSTALGAAVVQWTFALP